MPGCRSGAGPAVACCRDQRNARIRYVVLLYVTQARYGSETVIIFENCCPYCMTLIPVYNCAGEFLGNVGNGPDEIDVEILERDTVVWASEDSTCVF